VPKAVLAIQITSSYFSLTCKIKNSEKQYSMIVRYSSRWSVPDSDFGNFPEDAAPRHGSMSLLGTHGHSISRKPELESSRQRLLDWTNCWTDLLIVVEMKFGYLMAGESPGSFREQYTERIS
jgi:hypothetical protein